MGQKDISPSGSREIGREHTRALIVRPAVDIFETNVGLTLVVDMPGVSKESLQIDIDQGLLTIKADAKSRLKGEAVQQEFVHGNFYRQFQIPNEIATEKISAEMLNGVLTLQLPKAEAAKPRRIEIH
jgi:HSP20 family molecular chaperone IbpA